ncbi:hypothetical protein C8J57DRAFT_1503398 [Mycena rebaudengoi]|nr:hypothetical protein C8J57DRAFT_1503398 [Mycena rebaudengoi]
MTPYRVLRRLRLPSDTLSVQSQYFASLGRKEIAPNARPLAHNRCPATPVCFSPRAWRFVHALQRDIAADASARDSRHAPHWDDGAAPPAAGKLPPARMRMCVRLLLSGTQLRATLPHHPFALSPCVPFCSFAIYATSTLSKYTLPNTCASPIRATTASTLALRIDLYASHHTSCTHLRSARPSASPPHTRPTTSSHNLTTESALAPRTPRCPCVSPVRTTTKYTPSLGTPRSPPPHTRPSRFSRTSASDDGPTRAPCMPLRCPRFSHTRGMLRPHAPSRPINWLVFLPHVQWPNLRPRPASPFDLYLQHTLLHTRPTNQSARPDFLPHIRCAMAGGKHSLSGMARGTGGEREHKTYIVAHGQCELGRIQCCALAWLLPSPTSVCMAASDSFRRVCTPFRAPLRYTYPDAADSPLRSALKDDLKLQSLAIRTLYHHHEISLATSFVLSLWSLLGPWVDLRGRVLQSTTPPSRDAAYKTFDPTLLLRAIFFISITVVLEGTGAARVLISGSPTSVCMAASDSFDGPLCKTIYVKHTYTTCWTLDNLTTEKLPHTDRHHARALPHSVIDDLAANDVPGSGRDHPPPVAGGVSVACRAQIDTIRHSSHDAVSITVPTRFDTLRHKRQILGRIDVRASELGARDVRERVCERRKYGKLVLPTTAVRCMQFRRISLPTTTSSGWEDGHTRIVGAASGMTSVWLGAEAAVGLGRVLPRSPRTLSPVVRDPRRIDGHAGRLRERRQAQAVARALAMDLGDIAAIETLFPVRARRRRSTQDDDRMLDRPRRTITQSSTSRLFSTSYTPRPA